MRKHKNLSSVSYPSRMKAWEGKNIRHNVVIQPIIKKINNVMSIKIISPPPFLSR
jgi:hypothetical protein